MLSRLLLVRLGKVLQIRAGTPPARRILPICVRRRRLAYRHRHLALQFLPVGTAVLRHRDPAIDIEDVRYMLDVEQRRRQRIVLRLLSVVIRTLHAPGKRVLEHELHRVRVRRGSISAIFGILLNHIHA